MNLCEAGTKLGAALGKLNLSDQESLAVLRVFASEVTGNESGKRFNEIVSCGRRMYKVGRNARPHQAKKHALEHWNEIDEAVRARLEELDR